MSEIPPKPAKASRSWKGYTCLLVAVLVFWHYHKAQRPSRPDTLEMAAENFSIDGISLVTNEDDFVRLCHPYVVRRFSNPAFTMYSGETPHGVTVTANYQNGYPCLIKFSFSDDDIRAKWGWPGYYEMLDQKLGEPDNPLHVERLYGGNLITASCRWTYPGDLTSIRFWGCERLVEVYLKNPSKQKALHQEGYEPSGGDE